MFSFTNTDVRSSQLQTISEISEYETATGVADSESIDEGVGTYSESGSEYAEKAHNIQDTASTTHRNDNHSVISQYTAFQTVDDCHRCTMGQSNLSYIYSSENIASDTQSNRSDTVTDTERQDNEFSICTCYDSVNVSNCSNVIACTKL